MMVSVVDERVTKSEDYILNEVDEKVTKAGERFLNEVEGKISQTEGFILDEIERTRNILEKQIEKVQNNIEELDQYYRITKLENDNITLILKMIDALSKRVDELEKKSA